MPVNPNFASQGVVVPGGYAQPAPGVTEQIETPADPSGNSYATSLASGGTANLQTANYRDSVITVQATGTTTTTTAGTVVATITPGTAGLWEITGFVTVTGTTVAAADTNNMALYQTSTARLNPIMFTVPGTTGMTTPQAIPAGVILNLSGADTVNIKNVATSTASSTYQATIVARRVG